MPAIEVHELTRTFVTGRRRNRRTTEAVKGISFAVDAGERLALIGPNGAGKSTSIKMLTGILHPTSGRASVLGLVPWDERRELTTRIGSLFGQRSLLWQELTPRVSYRMLGAIFGLDDDQVDHRVAELGELLDAADLFDQPIRTQSLGQRMRCELTACMLHGPEVLVLDEPTIGLDLLAKQRFRDLLVQLNDELDTTVLLTSHDVADIEHVADRAIIVNHGAIVYDAPVAQMRGELLATKRVEVGLEHPEDAARLIAALDRRIISSAPSISVLRLDVDTTVTPIRSVLDTVLRTIAVADLSVVDPPLEHVIGAIYERPA